MSSWCIRDGIIIESACFFIFISFQMCCLLVAAFCILLFHIFWLWLCMSTHISSLNSLSSCFSCCVDVLCSYLLIWFLVMIVSCISSGRVYMMCSLLGIFWSGPSFIDFFLVFELCALCLGCLRNFVSFYSYVLYVVGILSGLPLSKSFCWLNFCFFGGWMLYVWTPRFLRKLYGLPIS